MHMKKITLPLIPFAIAGLLIMHTSCGGDKKQQSEASKASTESTANLSEADAALIKQASQIFGVLPDKAENANNPLNDDKVKLGKMLYYEPRLSKSGWISCNSCHNLATYGVDNLPTSIGHKWNIGDRNAPTSFNAALHIAQFWDGRAADVEEQAKGPVLNPGEMASPHEQFAVDRIASIKEYAELFTKVFPGETNALTYNNIAKAIGAFERTLLTPSRFDEYMQGKADALNEQEKKGMQTFINSGCITCHMGSTVGGNMYQKFGVKKDYWTLTKSKKKDEGRAVVTKKPEDKYFFKVPSLRNVERTYPYFHDGSIWTLDEAVSIMGELQLDKKFTADEVADIVAFLKALTAPLPETAKEIPVLPASAANTSKPDFN
jgi:cytochrome c peroxidase